MVEKSKKKIALVLTGGGARAAYQAGALRAIFEITREMGIERPFSIITGSSAGAINASLMASYAHDLDQATRVIEEIWCGLTTDKIMQTGVLPLTCNALRWMGHLTLGGMLGVRRPLSLLDTSPLRRLVTETASYDKVRENIHAGHLDVFAVSAVNYALASSHTFFYSNEGETIQAWRAIRRTGERTVITPDHIMASTAIPILFPPVEINGSHYGDGSLRNYMPMSPALRLGADKLLTIGVRREEADWVNEVVVRPSLARIFSVMLNSVLLDAIDLDHEHLLNINKAIETNRDAGTHRYIDVCMLRPSLDVGQMAWEEAHHMPRTIRYMLGGLGSRREATGVISYLLFEPPFLKRLYRLGFEDTYAREYQVKKFFSDEE